MGSEGTTLLLPGDNPNPKRSIEWIAEIALEAAKVGDSTDSKSRLKPDTEVSSFPSTNWDLYDDDDLDAVTVALETRNSTIKQRPRSTRKSEFKIEKNKRKKTKKKPLTAEEKERKKKQHAEIERKRSARIIKLFSDLRRILPKKEGVVYVAPGSAEAHNTEKHGKPVIILDKLAVLEGAVERISELGEELKKLRRL
eukprot:g3103.t1